MARRGQFDPSIRDSEGNIISWKVRNRSRSNESARIRRAKNRQKIRLENRSYRERNPFSCAVTVAKTRAKVLGVVSTLTVDEWKEVVIQNNSLCHICKEPISLEIGSKNRLSLDHVLPMSRGGQNTKDNVLPSHRLCNQSRLSMTMEEFDLWLNRVYENRRNGYGKKA